jgi:cell wall-associated NlpC family hydrolase
MKTAEAKRTDSRAHTSGNRSFFDRDQAAPSASRPASRATGFFQPPTRSTVQAKQAADPPRFFPGAPARTPQGCDASCSAAMTGEQSGEPRNPLRRAPSQPVKIQAKPTVGAPEDRYEQEADRIAETVMRMPDPRQSGKAGPDPQPQALATPRSCSRCRGRAPLPLEAEDQAGNHLRAEAASSSSPPVTPEVEHRIHGLQGTGQPLPATTRAFFELRFGHDFGRVRVHTDEHAAESARELKARAFTRGGDIVFASGQYAPQTLEGQRLLAHELTHTIQQGSAVLRAEAPAVQREQQTTPAPASTAAAAMARAAATALSCVGDHYLRGTQGELPGEGEVTMHPGHPHTARNGSRWTCSGKHLDPAVAGLPRGERGNPRHGASPGDFAWQRRWRGDTVSGEACEGERHFDCSGLVFHVFDRAGLGVPRLTARGYRSRSTSIQSTDLGPGDLCFTSQDPDHVGIYAGNNRVVDAYPGWGVRLTELSGTELFDGAGGWDELGRLSLPQSRSGATSETGERGQGEGTEAGRQPEPAPIAVSATSDAPIARLPAVCEPPSGLTRTDTAAVDLTRLPQHPAYGQVGSGAPRRRGRACNRSVEADAGLPIYAYFFPSTHRDAATALVLGGIHGDERPGFEMVSAMAAELARASTGTAGATALAYHTILIPCVNPGGVIDADRCNRWDVDINRNFVPGAGSHRRCDCTRTAPLQPETEAVQRTIRRFIRTGRGDRILSGHSVGRAQAGVFADPSFRLSAMDLARRMIAEGRLPERWRAGNALPAAGESCAADRAHLCEIRAYCDSENPNPENSFRPATLRAHPALRDRFVLAWVCLNEFYPAYARDAFGLYPSRGSLGHYMGEYMRQRGPHGLAAVPVITIEAPGTASLGGRGRPSVEAYLRLIRHFLGNAPTGGVPVPERP